MTDIPEVPSQALWWKPQRWNEGGFDAVYVDKKRGLVRFVQLTVSKHHAFRIECFHHLLQKLSQKIINNELSLEIYFLSPTGTKFGIYKVTGQGLLHAFRGWEKCKESESVKICTLDFSC